MPETYIIMTLVVLGINAVPAFMPATWSILAFFYITYHLEMVPTVILGATAAVIGRLILASLSRSVIRPRLSPRTQKNYKALGKFLTKKKHITIPLVIGYAFLPIPSNQVFIAAGVAEVSVQLIALCFFIGRLFSYSIWVSVAHHVTTNLGVLIASHYSHFSGMLLEIMSLAILILIGYIPWSDYLPHPKH
ncbi:hypothetical protein HGB07_02335 [Candidatus Roizmanbacteria bacterium]|nr:hypothetical protein [Candidatus Roizmanbacteria bacterium]